MKAIRVTNELRKRKDMPAIEVGTEVKIVGEFISRSGQLHYAIEGFERCSEGYLCFYDARAFAIPPDTSADDMADQEKEAIINLDNVHPIMRQALAPFVK